jgi:uncharacterized cupin superfamily protein
MDKRPLALSNGPEANSEELSRSAERAAHSGIWSRAFGGFFFRGVKTLTVLTKIGRL